MCSHKGGRTVSESLFVRTGPGASSRFRLPTAGSPFPFPTPAFSSRRRMALNAAFNRMIGSGGCCTPAPLNPTLATK